MSTANYFINVNPSLTTNKNFDKSISMIEPSRSNLESQLSISEMSYNTSELPTLSRHLSQSNIAPAKQNYEDLVSCPVCFDVFDNVNQKKFPKILPCQHTYCVECITNLMHCSNKKVFCCPQCKYEVENVKDAQDLPTSRIVLSLLEKESLNYQGYASCPNCRQIRTLEVCFECNLPLCTQCVSKHFENWKNGINQNCVNAEGKLDLYKQKLDKVNTFVTQNFENVQTIKEEIEHAFTLLYQRLNTEKELLLKSINDIKDENSKYVNLRKEIVGLIASFKVFRESNENFEKKAMMGRTKKYQMNFEQIPKLEKEFQTLASNSFKVLERFDKNPIPELDFYYSGNLIVNQINLESPQLGMTRNSSHNSFQQSNVPPVQAKVTIPGLEPQRENLRNVRNSNPDFQRTSSNARLTNQSNINVSSNQEILSKWVLTSQIKPQSESTTSANPTHMTSYQNLLFCMDQSSSLFIYEKSFTVELKMKNTMKLNIPNIKCIAANNNYLAVCYAGLRKEQLKGNFKNIGPNGILLYRRDHDVVLSIHEKTIELGKGESFKSLSGIAMTDKHLYAIDRELRVVLKFDIKSGGLVCSQPMPDSELYSISVNQTCLTVIDSLNSTLHLLNAENLSKINSINLKHVDQVNGSLNTIITNDNLIFVRNSETQISLFDINLELKAVFNEIQAKILNVCLVSDQNNQMLAIGALNRQQFKLYGYVV